MKRKFNIYMLLAVSLLTLSCSKEKNAGDYGIRADYEPDTIMSEITVAASMSSAEGIEADIILNLNGEHGSVTTSLQEAVTFEVPVGESSFQALRHNGICYAAIAGIDGALVSEAVSHAGGQWVLYLNGEFSSQAFIGLIEGFMGEGASYHGPGLYMHTALYSRVGSFAKDESQVITFTIKGEDND